MRVSGGPSFGRVGSSGSTTMVTAPGSRPPRPSIRDRAGKRRRRELLREYPIPVKCPHMPELSRFFGITIRMYWEANVPHHRAHFHAYYQDEVAVYSIETVELIAGSLPRRQQRLVEAWAELHQQELSNDWELLQSGQTPQPIDPLS